MATLREIEEAWSLSDLLDANDALDLKEEAEAKANERSNQSGGA